MENKSFIELREIINKGNAKSNWKEMHSLFGCHLANKINAKDLDAKAFDMIKRCKEWITNWETVREGIKPELQAKRAEQLDEKAKELESYSQEELEALWRRVNEFKAV